MRKGLSIFLIIFSVIILIILIGALTFNKNFKDFLEDLNMEYDAIEMIDLSTIKDGDYQGKYGNMPIMFDLQVTVKDHKINKIVVLEKSTGPEHEALETIEYILDKQNCKVDVVSGATTSSKTIMVATYLALTSQTSK